MAAESTSGSKDSIQATPGIHTGMAKTTIVDYFSWFCKGSAVLWAPQSHSCGYSHLDKAVGSLPPARMQAPVGVSLAGSPLAKASHPPVWRGLHRLGILGGVIF